MVPRLGTSVFVAPGIRPLEGRLRQLTTAKWRQNALKSFRQHHGLCGGLARNVALTVNRVRIFCCDEVESKEPADWSPSLRRFAEPPRWGWLGWLAERNSALMPAGRAN
jgi:hypothetical protein